MFVWCCSYWRLTLNQYFIVLVILSLATACNGNAKSQMQTAVTQTTVAQKNQSQRVVALGRLVPQGEVIKLSVANAQDSRVNKILVAEGDRVLENQVIAILQGFENQTRALEAAKKAVELAQAKLDQTQAGDTKQAQLAAQQANIARLESQLRNETIARQAAIASATAQYKQAQLTYRRNETLTQQGAISKQAFEQIQEQLDITQAALIESQAQLNNTQQTLRQEIIQEQENLAKLQEIRPVDVKVAEIELEQAKIAVEQRQADLEDTQVKVPVSGQILRINTRVGEQVNTQEGIVELGNTAQMYAIAEVYETDIARVKVGQPAIINSEYGGFTGKLKGTVEHLGLQVGKKELSATSSADPTQDENSRIVEVKIRINPQDSQKVAGLTNMQVRVEIN